MADEITCLVHELQNKDDVLCFVKAAFQTFTREWNGIDVFRINKFMMVSRPHTGKFCSLRFVLYRGVVGFGGGIHGQMCLLAGVGLILHKRLVTLKCKYL